jgi:hypothetical protein
MSEGHETSSPSRSTARRSRLFDAEPDALLVEEWVPLIVLPSPPAGQPLSALSDLPDNALSIDGDLEDLDTSLPRLADVDEPRQGPARIYVGAGSPSGQAAARSATPSIAIPRTEPRAAPSRAMARPEPPKDTSSPKVPPQVESLELDADTESIPSADAQAAPSVVAALVLPTAAVLVAAPPQAAPIRNDRIIVTSGNRRWRFVRAALLVVLAVLALTVLVWLKVRFTVPFFRGTLSNRSSQEQVAVPATISPASVPASSAVAQGQAAPVTGNGFVQVECDVPATIYVDGKLVGPTPVRSFGVPVGRHAIRAVVNGDRVRSLDVQVSDGNVTPVKFTFGP